MKGNIYIVDTTLRDGEQTAGVVFTTKEKLRIAQLLDSIGVHQIEAGIPVMGRRTGGHQENCQVEAKSKYYGLEPGFNR